jgi:hypothetical protein
VYDTTQAVAPPAVSSPVFTNSNRSWLTGRRNANAKVGTLTVRSMPPMLNRALSSASRVAFSIRFAVGVDRRSERLPYGFSTRCPSTSRVSRNPNQASDGGSWTIR